MTCMCNHIVASNLDATSSFAVAGAAGVVVRIVVAVVAIDTVVVAVVATEMRLVVLAKEFVHGVTLAQPKHLIGLQNMLI